jgi:peptidoglycan/xylan/chitin deacetylase (PgdA/CDA1 family)
MLNFRNTNLFFGTALIAAIVLRFVYHLPAWYFIVLVVLYSLVLFYGCYFIQSDFFMRVSCSAETLEKKIALSFDDGPVAGATADILHMLRSENVEAAFFCIGRKIPANAALTRRIVEEGHIIGNHSYSHHRWFDLFSVKKMLKDLHAMDIEMQMATGLKPRLFRPPYGVLNPNLKKTIIKGAYHPVGWSVRSYDTVIRDSERLQAKMQKALAPGAVYLFHDTSETTRSILPEFIRFVKDEGYQIVRLDKLLFLQPYA